MQQFPSHLRLGLRAGPRHRARRSKGRPTRRVGARCIYTQCLMYFYALYFTCLHAHVMCFL
jgi:hypothetical protein